MAAALHARTRRALEELGLTPAEAEVYVFLTHESPATGYRIAQAVGRPVGNVYKAIESLETKGAVLVADDDNHRVVRAVSLAEFAARKRAELDDACVRAGAGLATAEHDSPDDRLYQLSDRGQAIARARSMLEGAQRFVVGVATPGPMGAIAEELSSTGQRGVPAGVKAYAPVTVPRADIVLDPRGEAALRHGPGEWLILNADGREYLAALFDAGSGDLLSGHWSSNPLLAWVTYTGLSSDMLLAHARAALAAGGGAEQVQSILQSLRAFESPVSAGKQWLADRFRLPSPARRKSTAEKGERRA